MKIHWESLGLEADYIELLLSWKYCSFFNFGWYIPLPKFLEELTAYLPFFNEILTSATNGAGNYALNLILM